MKTITQLSAYESTPLMVTLFIVCFSAIALVLCVRSSRTKAPMHYFVAKSELPDDDNIDNASYGFLVIIAGAIIYFFI